MSMIMITELSLHVWNLTWNFLTAFFECQRGWKNEMFCCSSESHHSREIRMCGTDIVQITSNEMIRHLIMWVIFRCSFKNRVASLLVVNIVDYYLNLIVFLCYCSFISCDSSFPCRSLYRNFLGLLNALPHFYFFFFEIPNTFTG